MLGMSGCTGKLAYRLWVGGGGVLVLGLAFGLRIRVLSCSVVPDLDPGAGTALVGCAVVLAVCCGGGGGGWGGLGTVPGLIFLCNRELPVTEPFWLLVCLYRDRERDRCSLLYNLYLAV
jgi:O-antigen ligase